MIPALSAWTESPEPGISTSRTVSATWSISTSLCPMPTVSTKRSSFPAASSTSSGLQRRLGEPAEVAARRHRADEHARVEEVVGEPDPVAEQRALGERARRVDRDDADGRPCRADVADAARAIELDFPTPGGPVTPTV